MSEFSESLRAATFTDSDDCSGLSTRTTLLSRGGCTYVVTAILTWRRSRFAAPIFLAAIALLLFPAAFLVPGGQIFIPSVVIIVVIAFLGYQYLHRVREPAA